MKENLYRAAFLILMVATLLLAGAQMLRGDDIPPPPIKLDVFPKIVVAGMTTVQIRVNWRIQRHADNRKWSFVMQSTAGDFQLSEGSMDGEDSPILYPVCIKENIRPCFRNVYAGKYVLQACVYRTKGKPLCDRVELEVQ